MLNTSIRWMIQAQPHLYPINEADRRMLHLTFGTKDIDTAEADTATKNTDTNATGAAPA